MGFPPATTAIQMGAPVTAQLESGPSNGTVTLAADGSFVYRPPAAVGGLRP
jgi:hypothetical protein